jgi:alpha-1,6-mannosyltransferase
MSSWDQRQTLPLPRQAALGARLRLSLPRPNEALKRIGGLLALGAVLAATLAVVLVASSGPSVLVPRSSQSFPGWVAGPLHGLIGSPSLTPKALQLDVSMLVVAMMLPYVIAIVTARAVPARVVVIAVVTLHVILLLSPPFQLTDLFNYLGYARLGALHGLNPYSHVFAQTSHDPVYVFTTWRHLTSPYGPLFTAITYPLALISLPVAYWLAKIATVIASLVFLALVWQCARRLGRDPRTALVFVALNPIYLIWALGGFHNDFFMLDLSMAAVVLMLDRHDRAAGAALAAAVAIKFTALLLGPFLLLATPSGRRRLRVLEGAGAAVIPLAALSIALFGLTIPNLETQSTLLTSYSVPNLVGDAIGAGGGAQWLLHLADVGLALTVAWLLVRNRDWISSAGWATLALLVSLAWLVPWYVVWALPLAALGTSTRLRRWTVAMTVFLMLTFVPWTPVLLAEHHLSTMNGSAGEASYAREAALQR